MVGGGRKAKVGGLCTPKDTCDGVGGQRYDERPVAVLLCTAAFVQVA